MCLEIISIKLLLANARLAISRWTFSSLTPAIYDVSSDTHSIFEIRIHLKSSIQIVFKLDIGRTH